MSSHRWGDDNFQTVLWRSMGAMGCRLPSAGIDLAMACGTEEHALMIYKAGMKLIDGFLWQYPKCCQHWRSLRSVDFFFFQTEKQ